MSDVAQTGKRGAIAGAKTWSASVVAVLCLVAGSALGLLVVPRAPTPSGVVAPPPLVSLLGKTLPASTDGEVVSTRMLEKYLARMFTLRVPGAPTESFSLSQVGVHLDEKRLKQLFRDARDPSSPTRRLLAKESLRDGNEKSERRLVFPLPLDIRGTLLSDRLLRLKDEIDRRPKDARVQIRNKTVVKEEAGRLLDVDATSLAIKNAILSGELKAEAKIQIEAPERTVEQLKGLKFDQVLGHFETKYSKAKKYEDRTYNLALAAGRLDGTVLLPGEEFDFNDVVGARDEANGYKVATVIADGELVDGIGGGTCQISGTLHGAAFFAGLDIVERYPHTRPSSYIKMGMDATVVYPTINFRFRNPYDFPIAIQETVESGRVRAQILGAKRDQVVTLIRKVDQAIPYEQIEKKDPKLPRGTRILAQRGIPGFRLHRYRTIRRGSHATREKWRDVYPPTAQVVRVGAGDAQLEKKSSVGTPEYRADELLILTLRRPEGSKPGEFAENREPGRYGKHEWTREAGMPFWSGD